MHRERESPISPQPLHRRQRALQSINTGRPLFACRLPRKSPHFELLVTCRAQITRLIIAESVYEVQPRKGSGESVADVRHRGHVAAVHVGTNLGIITTASRMAQEPTHLPDSASIAAQTLKLLRKWQQDTASPSLNSSGVYLNPRMCT